MSDRLLASVDSAHLSRLVKEVVAARDMGTARFGNVNFELQCSVSLRQAPRADRP
jgi:hypothetical protein